MRKQSLTQRVVVPSAMAILFTVLIMPAASAAAIPLLGETEIGFNVGFILITIGVLAFLGGFAATREFVKGLPYAGGWLASGGAVLGVVMLLAASWVQPGGLLYADDSPATFVPGASAAAPAATGAANFDAALYEPVTKAIFYASDAAVPSTAVNPVLSIYKTGVAQKAAMEGTGVPLYSGTLSSGTLTIDGIQVQQYGCMFDIGVDAANYYEKIVPNVNLCRAKNANGLNTVSVPTIFLEKIGTNSLSLTATSLTCSAGSTCTYSLVVRNSVADTKLANIAVKFVNTANATLDSVVTGSACELIDSSGTQYVKISADLGSLESRTCNVQITRAAGSADGSWKWTMDDLFQYNGATGWNTNSNTRGAGATAATTVTFA